MRLVDLTNKRFGRLVVIQRSVNQGKEAAWICLCDCGIQCSIRGISLRRGLTQSCGCLQRDRAREAQLKHGEGGRELRTVEYDAWQHMLRRCSDVTSKDYKNYGGRGIKVCERWKTYSIFLADVGRKPTPQHSLDRYPDNDGNYEPGNVRWATRRQQNFNQRHSDPAGGVYYYPGRSKKKPWLVMLGRQRLGQFATPEEAREVSRQARKAILENDNRDV